MYSSHPITSFNIFSFSSHAPSSTRPRFLKIHKPFFNSVESETEIDESLKTASRGRFFWEKDADFADREGKGVKNEKRISGIDVPRQRYISVSKAELLDGILSMFESREEVEEFLRFSSCLDSILHAEHKSILEQMRVDFLLTRSLESKGSTTNSSQSVEKMVPGEKPFPRDSSILCEDVERKAQEKEGHNIPMPFHHGLDLGFLFGSAIKTDKRYSCQESSVAASARFQHAFMKLLGGAQFEELSAQDLLWTSALNTDYLLTLPIYVDWKRASESSTIIFRRGYATERQKGFLIGEKLDYLQSRLLQKIFFSLSTPLKRVAVWVNEAIKSSSQTDNMQKWIETAKLWLKGPSFSERIKFYDETTLMDQSLSDSDLPIWLAAQKAVPRYEGFLSSLGPRGRLLRKLLSWVGIIPSVPDVSYELNRDSTVLEPYLRPNCLPRISLSDVWEPASGEYCGNNPWEMFKTAISILFSKSTIQEPAFQELILLYTEGVGQAETEDKAEVSSLQMKIYERIPFPDLPVIFPHKKLSFRILDAVLILGCVTKHITCIGSSFEGSIRSKDITEVRLDVASILGLSAFFVNYKFENILSSPSAFMLDVIAVGALVIYITRAVLGYKQTRDRYQLLVNKTLYEKTLASSFGTVHFLLDASEQQQYKEAILAYGLLLKGQKCEVMTQKIIGATCERFIYDKFADKVEMPIDKAMDTLLRLGLVTEVPHEGKYMLQALPVPMAYEALKARWRSFMG